MQPHPPKKIFPLLLAYLSYIFAYIPICTFVVPSFYHTVITMAKRHSEKWMLQDKIKIVVLTANTRGPWAWFPMVTPSYSCNYIHQIIVNPGGYANQQLPRTIAQVYVARDLPDTTITNTLTYGSVQKSINCFTLILKQLCRCVVLGDYIFRRRYQFK